MDSNRKDIGRRNILGGVAAGIAGTALTSAMVIGGENADKKVKRPVDKVYPFYGQHQSGILLPGPGKQQAASSFVAFDVITDSRKELHQLFVIITRRIRALMKGGPAVDYGLSRPASDSDVLGAGIPADGLTITLSVGASLFDHRFGFAHKRPRNLVSMKVFANDFLEPQWCHGDLLLQICADHADTVHHALRDILRLTRGKMQPRWRIEGYGSPSRPDGAGRNLLGFKDGTANPQDSLAHDLVWITAESDEPEWAIGGTYHVVRIIRMLVEFWDRISINEQERIFGRRRESGAPLDGVKEDDTPDYSTDPHGAITPLDSHIRRANPRSSKETEKQRLIRRSYNYDLGIDPNGNMQSGHIFVCFQQDIVRQFETVQLRLKDEPLIDYVQPFGGGYFLTLPGVLNKHDWLGRTLLTAEN